MCFKGEYTMESKVLGRTVVKIFLKVAGKQLSWVVVFVFIATVKYADLNISKSLNMFCHLLANNPIAITLF